MAAPSEKASFPLDLGVDEFSLPEAVQPVGDGAALVSSVNTRLWQRGVANKSPSVTEVATFDAGAACGGIVPAGHVDSSVAFFRLHAGGNLRISGSDTTELDGALSANPANAYWPAQVTRAGAVPGAYAPRNPAVCHNEGLTWFACLRNDSLSWDTSIYVSVIDDDGRVVVSPTKVADLGSGGEDWVGITAHGANGVRLWWNDTLDIVGAELSVAGLSLTVGTPVVIYRPLTLDPRLLSVVSNGDNDYAYMATVASSAATDQDIAIHKIDVSTLGASTTLKTGVLAGGSPTEHIVASHIVISGTGYLAIAWHNTTANEAKCTLYTTSAMAHVWTSAAYATPVNVDEVSAQFYKANGASYVVATCANHAGDLATPTTAITTFAFLDLAAGTTSATTTMQWLRMVGQGASYQVSANEIYPIFQMQHTWEVGAAVGAAEFVFDPSIEIYTVNGTSKLTPIARLGCNTAVRYIATTTKSAYSSSASIMVDSRFVTTYLRDNFRDAYNTDGYVVRYAEVDLDFEATGQCGPPRYAVTPEGGTVIAAALPAYWDGSEVTEFSPLHQPAIYVATTGGTGPSLTAGVYQFRAVISWKDSTGEIVRSLPSQSVSVTCGGTDEPKIWVFPPFSMKNGVRQERYNVQIYATLQDGSVFYAQPYEASSVGNDYWVFDDVDQPEAGYLNPLIYSTGSATSPLASECPGAIWDVACVGHRLWMINAENRSEALYTKPKESGIRFEWNYVNTIPFPASAGKLMAVADANGTPLFLTSTGLYQVAGEGPDANNQGQQFSKPFLVGTTHCTDRNSVITTPVGVMFVSGDNFALFSGGQVRTFDVDASTLGLCLGVAHFRDYEEIVWFGTSVAYVYNYARDRWTTWGSGTFGTTVACAAQLPVNGKLLFASTNDATIRLMDPDATSSTAQIELSTGWISLAGPQDDIVLRDLIVYAKRGGAHGLTVSIEMDYGAGVATTKTYSAAEITAGAQNGGYTLPMQLGTHSARAFKLTLTETDAAGAGFKPVSATVVFGRNPDVSRKSFVHALRK